MLARISSFIKVILATTPVYLCNCLVRVKVREAGTVNKIFELLFASFNHSRTGVIVISTDTGDVQFPKTQGAGRSANLQVLMVKGSLESDIYLG